MGNPIGYTQEQTKDLQEQLNIAALVGFLPEKIVFVDSGNSASTNGGTARNDALPTIDAAVGKCSANDGNVIYVMPGHAETASTQVTMDVAGVTVLGAGVGRSRPAITANASAVDLFNVTAANCKLMNLRLVGAASSTALLNLAATDFSAENCVFEHGAAPLQAVTVASGSSRFSFTNCRWVGTADGPDTALIVEASSVDEWVIRDCDFNYGTFGCDLGCILSSKRNSGYIIDRCVFVGMDTVAIDFNSSSSANCDGIISNCDIAMGADTANIDTAIDAGGSGIVNTFGTDNPDSAGSRIPVQTPA